MAVTALVIATAALLLCGMVALAVMELVAQRPDVHDSLSEDAFEEMGLAPGAEGTLASSLGLPSAIDKMAAHLVLVVAPMCATCQRFAASFTGTIPEHVTLMVTASDPNRMRAWVTTAGLHPDDVVFDDDMSIARALGVSSSPAVIGFVGGAAAFAGNLGGRRALDNLLEQRESILRDGELHLAEHPPQKPKQRNETGRVGRPTNQPAVPDD